MWEYFLGMMGELLTNMYHSTLQGYIGVNLIFAYMAMIIIVGVWRAVQAAKADH